MYRYPVCHGQNSHGIYPFLSSFILYRVISPFVGTGAMQPLQFSIHLDACFIKMENEFQQDHLLDVIQCLFHFPRRCCQRVLNLPLADGNAQTAHQLLRSVHADHPKRQQRYRQRGHALSELLRPCNMSWKRASFCLTCHMTTITAHGFVSYQFGLYLYIVLVPGFTTAQFACGRIGASFAYSRFMGNHLIRFTVYSHSLPLVSFLSARFFSAFLPKALGRRFMVSVL